MKTKQFLLLFVGMLLNYSVGLGLLPLLPLYAGQLGAPTALIGYYLAFAWLMISLGSLAGGWLCDRSGR